MQLSGRLFVSRFVTLPLLLAATLPFANQAAAQRAPELLPAQVSLIAGGGSALLANNKCPQSGVTATNAAGDGCLATEIILGTSATAPGPRYAIADANGNVFFSDYANSEIRRVDAITGIITAVAGGSPNPTPQAGTACGTTQSVDALGDGCLGTAVKLLHPEGLAFAPNGDLYFAENDGSTSSTTGGAHIRKIASTGGFITTTGTITLVLGQASNAKGYAANVSTTCTATVSTGCITAANSYLFLPFQLSVDTKGNLFIGDEYTKNAVYAFNPTTNNETINNVYIPAGTIGKVLGATSAGAQDCANSPATTNGCSYGQTTFGGQAASSLEDGVYGAAPDALGNLYVAGEYYNFVGLIAPSGIITEFAGIENSAAKTLTRAKAGTYGIGSSFGIATDANNNVYWSDASSGVVWRVDADTLTQYVVAGAGTVCSGAIDTYGDGCPATQATFGKSGSGNYASTTLPGPGIYGVSTDIYGNLYTGDTETNLVRQIGTGAQFGAIGATQPTNTLIVHYAPGDGPASSTPYVITTGFNNFALGTPGTCTTNSDNSKDCPVPVQATPAVLGPFSGTLTVTSAAGKTASFPLTGIYVQSPATRTTVTATAAGACAGSTAYSTTTSVTLTATIASSGTPGGTVQFYSNGVALGTPQGLTNGKATLTQTFPAGSYSITAVYSGDNYFKTSTSVTPATFSTSLATFYIGTLSTYQTGPVSAGQTALYSFTVDSSVYTGTLSFSCSGLPAGAACVFSPATISQTGCSATGTGALTEALSITTSAPPNVIAEGFGGGRGAWRLVVILSGVLLASMIGLRRRRMSTALGTLGMMAALLLASTGLTACSATVSDHSVATPSGTYPIVVTLLGSNAGNTPPAGFATTLPVTLIVK